MKATVSSSPPSVIPTFARHREQQVLTCRQCRGKYISLSNTQPCPTCRQRQDTKSSAPAMPTTTVRKDAEEYDHYSIHKCYTAHTSKQTLPLPTTTTATTTTTTTRLRSYSSPSASSSAETWKPKLRCRHYSGEDFFRPEPGGGRPTCRQHESPAVSVQLRLRQHLPQSPHVHQVLKCRQCCQSYSSVSNVQSCPNCCQLLRTTVAPTPPHAFSTTLSSRTPPPTPPRQPHSSQFTPQFKQQEQQQPELCRGGSIPAASICI